LPVVTNTEVPSDDSRTLCPSSLARGPARSGPCQGDARKRRADSQRPWWHGVRDGVEVARLAQNYLPREPHATVLYRLVKEHGAEFLRHARESYDGPLPRYVEDELRGYLRCGDFSRGFVHLRCPRCQHDLLV